MEAFEKKQRHAKIYGKYYVPGVEEAIDETKSLDSYTLIDCSDIDTQTNEGIVGTYAVGAGGQSYAIVPDKELDFESDLEHNCQSTVTLEQFPNMNWNEV
jgi:hypothetical protein